MESYCLRCKYQTPNLDIYQDQTSNGRHILKSTCQYCGGKKSRFIKGGSFFGDIAKKGFKTLANIYRSKFCQGKARPLEDGEYHYGCHNYSGPGTRLDLYRDYPPYNDVDNCSRTHDIEFTEAFNEPDPEKRKKLIRAADLKVIDCYNKYKNQNGASISKFFIEHKVNSENISPSIIKNLLGEKYVGGKKKRRKYLKNKRK